MREGYYSIHITNRVMKIRKFGNICSYKLCKGKRNGAYFIGDDGVFLLIFPDSKNMIYILNDILGYIGKLMDKLHIEIWCYAYYEEEPIHLVSEYARGV